MKSADDITRAIAQFEVRADPCLDERVRTHVREAFSSPVFSPATGKETRQRRVLSWGRALQLAAAAAVVVAALLGLYAWDILGTRAYAVEDTVKALRKIETVHAFCTDWKGRPFEVWMRPDPATGRNDFIGVIEPEQGSISVSTPRMSYVHDTAENSVRLLRGQLINSSLNMADIVGSLSAETDGGKDATVIARQRTDRYGEVITVHFTNSIYESEAWVDPKTKLLLRLENIRCNNPGDILRSMDEIRYNEPVPAWLLQFGGLDYAQIRLEGWGDIDNPKYGVEATDLSEEQACRKILARLFDAVNAADLAGIRRLIPAVDQWDDLSLIAACREVVGDLWDHSRPGLAAYEIESPYWDTACPLGVLVPCTLTDHTGRRLTTTPIVRFRGTGQGRTCVVVDVWGDIQILPGALYRRQPPGASDRPFRGPINSALRTSRSIILIVPTNEADEAVEQRIHDNVRRVQTMLSERLAGCEVKVLTDVEALQANLSGSSLGVYGTPGGNLWLAGHIAELPVTITSDRIVVERVYEGSDLRLISAWPHPQDANLGMILYTAQRAEDIININSVFHGPTDFVVARGLHIVHSASYVKAQGRWTLE